MPKIHPQPQPAPKPSPSALRRLPSIYRRCIELPLRRHDTVRVHFGVAADYYVVPRGTGGIRPGDEIKVRIVRVERYDMVRVVVHTGPGEPDLQDDLVYDKWRGGLPETSFPYRTVAGYVDGQLVVIVPKVEMVVPDQDLIPIFPNISGGGAGASGGGRGGLGGVGRGLLCGVGKPRVNK